MYPRKTRNHAAARNTLSMWLGIGLMILGLGLAARLFFDFDLKTEVTGLLTVSAGIYLYAKATVSLTDKITKHQV